MATTISLTGRLADIMSHPIDSINSVTVKAPSYRPGPGVELTTSQPTNVEIGGDGEITIDVVEGVGWIYVEGDGWSDSIRFVAAAGMTTLWEAVVNALPIVVEGKRLLSQLGSEFEDYRSRLLDVVTGLRGDLEGDYLNYRTLLLGITNDVQGWRDDVLAHVQALAEPNDAAVLGLITDGADTATKRELESNFVGKQRGETRYVYVREDGDDATGDGSYNAPFRQIQPAIDSIFDGPVIPGSVIIDVREGTYDGGIRIPIARARAQDDFIKIKGRVDADGVPTAIIQGSTGTGLLAEDGAALWIENVKFIGGFSVAVQLNRNVYGWFKNVHVDGQNTGVRGFSISQHCRYYVQGGLIENCTYAGIDEYFAVARSYATVSDSASQMLIRKCQIGIRCKEGCIGHMDYLNVTDCDTGIELLQNSVANLKGVTLKRNGTALALTNSTSHNEGGIVWGEGDDANSREVMSMGMSGELRAMMWSGEDMAAGSNAGHRPLMNIANDFSQRTITGDAGTTQRIAYFPTSIPRTFFRTVGKHFTVTTTARFVGASESSPITVTLRAGSVLLGRIVVKESAILTPSFDTVCTKNLTDHMTKSTLIGSSAPGQDISRTSTAFSGAPSGVASIELQASFTAPGQSLEFHSAEMWG